jgi:hypothetical protein
MKTIWKLFTSVPLIFPPVVTVLGFLFFLPGPARLHGEQYLSRSMQAQIMVADTERTAQRIVSWSERCGGYYLFKSMDLVVVRVPMKDLEELRLLTEREAEQVVSVSFEALDLRESIIRTQSGIQSREEILQKNLRYLDKADVEGTLAIEREISRLLQEIENLKGRLRKLTTDIRFASAEIHLSFIEQTLPQDVPSSFQWINTIDFYGFVQGGYEQ